jgi:hypothetical protein
MALENEIRTQVAELTDYSGGTGGVASILANVVLRLAHEIEVLQGEIARLKAKG